MQVVQTAYAGFIAAIIIISALSTGIIIIESHPMISTGYYHFNLQYRAGDWSSQDDIVVNSFQHIIWMYGNHTNWNYTVECQLLLLLYVQSHFPNVFQAVQEQNQRGQLELIVDQYSDAFQVPFPSTEFRQSINYTKSEMNALNLTQSPLVLLQEGQWLPAIGQVFGADPTLKAAIVSIEQFAYFNYYPSKPVVQWTLFGQTINVFVIPWIPIVQAGVYWQQIYTQDGEKINTGGAVNLNQAAAFVYNPDKQSNLEERLEQLQAKGNQFMTMGGFYEQCIAENQIEIMNLNNFVPETEWVAANYHQFYTWMGDGSGSSDDGLLLARDYYTSNLIQSTNTLLQKAYQIGNISSDQYNSLQGTLLEAQKCLWNATGTDMEGISPEDSECQYGLDYTLDAMNDCWTIINNITNQPNSPYAGQIQILPGNNTILTNPASFVNITRVGSTNFTAIENLFGVNISVSQASAFNSLYPIVNNTEIRNVTLNGETFQLYTMDFGFHGMYNITVGNNQTFTVNSTLLNEYNQTAGNPGSNTISVVFQGNWTNACYSPALAENYSIELQRSNYLTNPYGSSKDWVFYFSMCNGFLYNPQDGYAIIKNCSAYHLAALWDPNQISFTANQLKYTSNQEYFLVKGSLNDTLQLRQFS